ncbi:hypothetical protein ACFL0W_00275 [Nanoarchaeota archaeon]
MQKYNMLENIEIDKKRNAAIISLDPGIYSLDKIYKAAEEIMEKAVIILDGDPEQELLIELRLRSEGSIEDTCNKFMDLLITSKGKSK